ncbi:MAG: hypothetical protein PWP08_1302 [Methanofollis sp.]|nr:hypothetical protein [Methanofollis sp.]
MELRADIRSLHISGAISVRIGCKSANRQKGRDRPATDPGDAIREGKEPVDGPAIQKKEIRSAAAAPAAGLADPLVAPLPEIELGAALRAEILFLPGNLGDLPGVQGGDRLLRRREVDALAHDIGAGKPLRSRIFQGRDAVHLRELPDELLVRHPVLETGGDRPAESIGVRLAAAAPDGPDEDLPRPIIEEIDGDIQAAASRLAEIGPAGEFLRAGGRLHLQFLHRLLLLQGKHRRWAC